MVANIVHLHNCANDYCRVYVTGVGGTTHINGGDCQDSFKVDMRAQHGMQFME